MWISKDEFWVLKQQAEHGLKVDAQMRQERIRLGKTMESTLEENKRLTKTVGELTSQITRWISKYQTLEAKYNELIVRMR